MLGAGVNLRSWFRLKISYAATNGSYDNIGTAIVLNLGAFQIYGSMDNILGLTQLDYAKNLAVSYGINFVFGKNKDKEKIENSKKDTKSLLKNDDAISE